MTQIIEHIVLFKVKDDVESDKIEAMANDLKNLATIDQALYLFAGPIHRLISPLSFTHVLHSRYRSKEDLNAYVAHPAHLRAVEEWMPVWEDVMAFDYIADQVPGNLTPPHGSVAKITLLKVKENLSDEAKKEIMEVMKEKCPGAEQITVGMGETFSPVNAKGFSIASVAYLKGLGETEAGKDLVKEKVGEYVDDTIVVEFVVPLSS
ncbi:Stress-response A/B barrel domain-containing protein DABB1 [Hirschfeldia incana]|nr:Stress-response A/B barrel domain-containing protein DABB1 [Hirschfeldia incana]